MNTSRRHNNDDKPSVSGQPRTAVDSIDEVIVVLDSDEEGQTTVRGKKRKGDSVEDEVKNRKKKKTTASEQELCPEPLDMTWIHPESYPVAKR